MLRIFHEKFGIRAFAIFAILIFVISSSFTLFFICQQRKSLTDTQIKKGKLLAGILAYSSRLGVFSENEEMLSDPVEGVFQNEGVLEVSVFNLTGELLKSQKRSDVRTTKEDEEVRNRIFEKLRETASPFYLEDKTRWEFWSPVMSASPYLSEESLFFEEAPVQRKGRVIGFVKITLDKKMLDKRLHSLLFKSIMMAIIFFVLGSAAIYLLVKGITRPLNRLTEGVKSLGKKGSVEKIPVETEDEIGKLAEAFNKMAESLERREAEKEQLERQLRHAQKMEAIGTLAGGIAHDFNNILGAIVGYTELAMLDVPAGTTVALVGHTGCGKTTIISLLLRFYRVTSGTLTIDGVDINRLSRANLKRDLAMVPQDPVLFEGTVRENIAYGRPEASLDQIISAAKSAEIHRTIMDLPDGYDTKLGTEAVKLSVGQKQRLIIARAILADPAILILDEATSSLDTEAERLLQKALTRIMANRTCFVVAHRLSTIVGADLIVVLSEGRIIEMGRHQELLAKEDSYYRQLYFTQFAKVA